MTGKIDFGRQAHGLSHDAVVENGLAIVADAHRSGPLQRAEVGKYRTFAGMSRGCDRKDVHHRAALRLLQPGDPLRRVNDGLRVGHTAHGSKSSRGCRGRAGGDGFLVALSGFAQMNMQIDEAGSHD